MIRLVNIMMFIAVIALFATVYHVRYGADAEYKAIRQVIRDYLVSGLNRDDALMQASFTTKRR